MKTVTVLFIILAGTLLWIMPRLHHSESKKAYTVKMIFGNSKIGYTSEMQVDSVQWISNQQALVYSDSFSLKITAAYITFKKN